MKLNDLQLGWSSRLGGGMDFALLSTVPDRTAILGVPAGTQRKSIEKTKSDATTSTLVASARQ